MSICEFFIDRYDTDHLVDQAVHYMEGIGDASYEGDNGMDKFFWGDLLVGGAVTL